MMASPACCARKMSCMRLRGLHAGWLAMWHCRQSWHIRYAKRGSRRFDTCTMVDAYVRIY